MSERLTEKRLTRRTMLKFAGLGAGLLVAACKPQIVEVEKIVEKPVIQTVEVEKVVEKAVVQTVEVEKIVEKKVVETVVVEKPKIIEKVVKETIIVEREAPKKAELTAYLKWDTFRGQPTAFKWNEERMLSFKDKFPNVVIEFRPSPGGQQAMYGRYMTLIAAGDLGDLVSFDPGLYHLRRAVEADIIMPLEDLMAADGLDLTEWFKVFIDMQRYKGHVWGLPSWAWAGYDCLVTNALFFKEAGIELPAPDEGGPPMDTLAEWAHKFYKKGETYGLQLAYMDHGLEVITRSFGGDVLNKEGTKCLLYEDEKSRQGMKWAYDLSVVDKIIPQGEDLKPAGQGALVAGKLAMYQCGSLCTVFAAKAVTDKTLCEVTQFLYPLQPDGRFTNAVRCGSWNVAKHTKYPEAAYQFTKHIAGREGTIGFNLFGGNGALGRPDAFIALEAANPMYEWFKEPLEKGIVINEPANSRGPEYTDILAGLTQKMMDKYNPIPFEEGLKELSDGVQKVLDKPMQ